MLAPVRRVSVEIEPQTWEIEHDAVIYKVRASVDSGGFRATQEMILKNDDFESRFDSLFEMLKHSLVAAVEREAKSTTFNSESLYGKA
jgi:hypothetical protein